MPTYLHRLGGFPDQRLNYGTGIGGFFHVISKTATTVTFDPPLPFDFSGMSPVALSAMNTTVKFTGLESFTLDRQNQGTQPCLQMGGLYI